MPEQAVLLVNLGSPASTSVPDVRRYLRAFLGDERVIDYPAWFRWLLLEGIILRVRPKKSAHAYAKVWTPDGPPLLVTTEKVRAKLEAALATPGSPAFAPGRTGAESTAAAGPLSLPVLAGMRYGQPSIAGALTKLRDLGVREVFLIPQYPHYAMSSWETVVVAVHEEARRVAPGLRFTTVQPFFADADYIEALHAVSAPSLAGGYDHLLISFHGVPVRHLRKADSSRAHCQCVADCCAVPSPAHATCYRAQCLGTVRAFAARAGLPAGKYSVSFQSRLPGEPWLEPFTDRELVRLARSGVRKLLVMTPAFTADCLETLEEIAVEGKKTFMDAGGTHFHPIACLNDQPAFIDFLARRTRAWMATTAVARS
jgi:ferrochelatase